MSRCMLDDLVSKLIKDIPRSKVTEFLKRHYRVDKFSKLTNEQLDDFIRRVRDGELK